MISRSSHTLVRNRNIYGWENINEVNLTHCHVKLEGDVNVAQDDIRGLNQTTLHDV